MKRICFILFIIILLFSGVVLWHIAEENSRRVWKVKAISAIDFISEKSKDKNYSKEDLKEIQDSLTDMLGNSLPVKCPYCFMKYYINN